MSDPLAGVERRLLDLGCKRPGSRNEYFCCPAHDDRNPSLHLGRGEGGRALLHCHAGCSLEEILAALGLNKSDLFPREVPRAERQPIAVYRYIDAQAKHVYSKLRFDPKDFGFVRADGRRGRGCMTALERVLYRLPEVLETAASGGTVYVVEGEKAADALAGRGFTATCSDGGAGRWCDKYARCLVGALLVTIVADRDTAGRAHAALVAASLNRLNVASQIVEAATGGPYSSDDAHDHLAAGLAPEDFIPSLEPELNRSRRLAHSPRVSRPSSPVEREAFRRAITESGAFARLAPGVRHLIDDATHLADARGCFWIKQAAWGKRLGVNRRTIQRRIDLAKREGLLESERHARPDGYEGASNYRLVPPTSRDDVNTEASRDQRVDTVTPVPRGEKAGCDSLSEIAGCDTAPETARCVAVNEAPGCDTQAGCVASDVPRSTYHVSEDEEDRGVKGNGEWEGRPPGASDGAHAKNEHRELAERRLETADGQGLLFVISGSYDGGLA
jgi:hypothetical protein